MLSGHVLTASHFADAFHFFECRHNQKQPETAQKIDLKLRDVNLDRNGPKSSSSCGTKSVETGQEVGWT